MRRECCDAAMYQHGHVNYIQSTCRACIVSPVPAMPLRVPPQQQLGAHHSSEMVQWLLIFTGADLLLGRVCHAFSCSLLQSSNPMVRPLLSSRYLKQRSTQRYYYPPCFTQARMSMDAIQSACKRRFSWVAMSGCALCDPV
jgi:hypothetical protein